MRYSFTRLKWLKRGFVFRPQGQEGWMASHAQVPTPILINGVLRIYFASRPKPGISLTTYLDLDPDNPTRIIELHKKPILALGGPGTFDEFGIMPSCAIEHDGAVYLYYSGWSRLASVPYHNTTGLAISEDGGRTFKKVGQGPILERTVLEPFSATSPFVMKEGGRWFVFYSSGTGWPRIKGKFEHTYDIKYGISKDGIWWIRKGRTAVAQKKPLEAITRPTILGCEEGFHMLFCYRGSEDFREGHDSYQLGYAFSKDLETWFRDDGIQPLSYGRSGDPDSNMTAYPALVQKNTSLYLFYNGNAFGRYGLLLAVAEAEQHSMD